MLPTNPSDSLPSIETFGKGISFEVVDFPAIRSSLVRQIIDPDIEKNLRDYLIGGDILSQTRFEDAVFDSEETTIHGYNKSCPEWEGQMLVSSSVRKSAVRLSDPESCYYTSGKIQNIKKLLQLQGLNNVSYVPSEIEPNNNNAPWDKYTTARLLIEVEGVTIVVGFDRYPDYQTEVDSLLRRANYNYQNYVAQGAPQDKLDAVIRSIDAVNSGFILSKSVSVEMVNGAIQKDAFQEYPRVIGSMSDPERALRTYAHAYAYGRVLNALYFVEGSIPPEIVIPFELRRRDEEDNDFAGSVARETTDVPEVINKGISIAVVDFEAIFTRLITQVFDEDVMHNLIEMGRGDDKLSESEFRDQVIAYEKTMIHGVSQNNKGTGGRFWVRSMIFMERSDRNSPAFWRDPERITQMREYLIEQGFAVKHESVTDETKGMKHVIYITYGGYGMKIDLSASIESSNFIMCVVGKMPPTDLSNTNLGMKWSNKELPHVLDDDADPLAVIEAYAKMYTGFLNSLYLTKGVKPPEIRIDFVLSNSELGIKRREKSKEAANPPLELLGFRAVAGQDQAVAEARKLVKVIKDPEQYRKRGVKPIKGILLYGSPGNGKTSLARAIAEEVGAEFIEVNPTDVRDMWYGNTEKNMQEVFDKAIKTASSGKQVILFIDEIDTFAPSRQDFFGGRADKGLVGVLARNLDGFRPMTGVTLIGATNLQENIDPALLRPGRIDKTIHVGLPDLKGRVEILQVHIDKVRERATSREDLVSPDLDLNFIATITEGMSGADLENIINRTFEDKVHLKNAEDSAIPWTPLSTSELVDYVVAYKEQQRLAKIRGGSGKSRSHGFV